MQLAPMLSLFLFPNRTQFNHPRSNPGVVPLKKKGHIFMEIVRIQLAIFFKHLISRPDHLAKRIDEKLGGIFDAMPEIIGLPMDAPPEIPIVRCNSTKFPYELSIARNRCDFFIKPQQENRDLEIIELRYSKYISNVIESSISDNEITRIGIVYSAFEEQATPCDFISYKYFGSTVSRANELSFRMNREKQLNGIKINNILKVENATRKKDNVVGVAYTRDINSSRLSETKKSLTKRQIASILDFSYSLLTKAKFGEVK